MPNPTKTFTALSDIPKANIGKCSFVLPNKMQCWRAGEVQVSLLETIPVPTQPSAPADAKNKTPDASKEPSTVLSFYQLCAAHAAIERYEYDQAVSTEAAQSEQAAQNAQAASTKS